MIVGIGIDTVSVKRFEKWPTYSRQKLMKIFSALEIEHCLQEPRKSAERFAARFAAREALFKALCQAGYKMPFLLLCKRCEISVTDRGPQLVVHDDLIPKYTILLSLTHSSEVAFSIVMLQTVP